MGARSTCADDLPPQPQETAPRIIGANSPDAMRLLQYEDLDLTRVRAAFDKVRAAIEADDFRSADVKKLHHGPYYRARLDYANRLLLRFARHGGQKVCLALEVIENHAYDRSRFLRGAAVDEARIEQEPLAPESQLAEDALDLRCLPQQRARFQLLDKPIVFDDAQDEAWRLPVPLVLIGPAGSGKTAVTLARLRQAPGRVLFVTLSSYLAQSAQALYAAHGYENPQQEVDFLSYRELLETVRVPAGREITAQDFRGWWQRHQQALRSLAGLDAHALYEEFRGVLAAQADGPLSLQAYLDLGARQSLVPVAQRDAVHGLFLRYCRWLDEAGLFDPSLVAHAWLDEARRLAELHYDFVVIDEVQDLTPAQLSLVLGMLRKPGQFLLCGDSHQIVHPNFFSWAAVKSLFWRGLAGEAAQRRTLQLLRSNYRNSRGVTALANRLLRVKQARFGSVDRESSFQVESTAAEDGRVSLLPGSDAVLKVLDAATRQSARHAVIVLRDEDKPAARAQLRTPLVFSVHEAKGLEYDHVVLFQLVSGQRAAFSEVCEGVQPADLEGEALDFRRARDKADKSLELFKFYVNALYVAMTRAVLSLTLVESDARHPLLGLLGLRPGESLAVPVAQASSREEWAQEAHKLELQGKQEQAQAIRQAFLQARPVPWTPWSREHVEELARRALDPSAPGAKPRQALMDYALWHGQSAWINALARAGFAPARQLVVDGWFVGVGLGNAAATPGYHQHARQGQEQARRTLLALRQRHLQPYTARNPKELLRLADAHGVDHRTLLGATTLMLAARAGNAALVQALLDRGADPALRDEFGHTAWQHAIARALEDADFAARGLPSLVELLAPQVLDVQTGGRLVRLERHQAEYWLLSLMLAGLKTQWSDCVTADTLPGRRAIGFSAEQLHGVMEHLPAWLWPEPRRKRSYVSQVLARAELRSSYRPARQLWARTRQGHYLPNPALKLRQGEGWQAVYEVMALDWVDRGCGNDAIWTLGPGQTVDALRTRDQEGGTAPDDVSSR